MDLSVRRRERVDVVGVPGIDQQAAVVAALGVADPLVGRIHLPPHGTAVVGPIEPVVGDQVDPLRVGIHGHRDGGHTLEPRQAATGQLLPGDPSIDRLEQTRAGRGVRRRGRASGRDPARRGRSKAGQSRGREDHVRQIGGDRHPRHAGGVADEERLGPGHAAVRAPIDPAGLALGSTALGADQHYVGVARIDDDCTNSFGGFEPKMLPGLPGVR